jgi:hypothetical protein
MIARMKRPVAIFLVIVAFVAGVGAGFLGGCRYRQFDLALQENKVAAANLKMDTDFYGSTNLSPQFREYLKARIYCNVYNYYSSDRGYLLRKDWDFGPVDRNVLGTVGVWKDPHQKVWDWDAAVKEK